MPPKRILILGGTHEARDLAALLLEAGFEVVTSLAGVTENPVRLTKSVKDALTRVTAGGAPCYVWPGGGITFMVDVTQLPENAFGSVPTPALVAPIEFTMTRADYQALGGHMDHIRPLASVTAAAGKKRLSLP